MKTVYIYLSRRDYTEEHINHMDAMLSCMGTAGEIFGAVENERVDLNSLEIQTEASPWAVEFLKHLNECDMLYVTDQPIAAN